MEHLYDISRQIALNLLALLLPRFMAESMGTNSLSPILASSPSSSSLIQ